MISVLIVEDEPNYSDTLEMFVEQLGYRISGVAQEAHSATESFRKNRPDIVLMDIQLKGPMTGIDLARSFQETSPTPIIFLTSFDDKETFERAKETCPSAYLIKPFDPDTLERSMELALRSAFDEEDKVFESDSDALLTPNCFFIKERNRLIKVGTADILWIEVEDKYCMLHTTDRKFALRKSLKELASLLDPGIFVQTHRSFIVNACKITDIDTHTYVVRIEDHEVPLGKTYKDELINRLRLL